MNDRIDDTAKLAQMLRTLNYEVEGRGDDKVLHITTGGLNVTVVVYDDGSLSLVCSIAAGEVKLRLSEINDANNRVRFAKFSVDGEQLILEADFMFSLHAPEAEEELHHIMNLWTLALQELRHLVDELLLVDA